MHYNKTTLILKTLIEYAMEGTAYKEEIKVETEKLLQELLKPNTQPPQLSVNDLVQWLFESFPTQFSESILNGNFDMKALFLDV